MSEESVLIVGTVSNVSNVLIKEFEKVFKSLIRFNSISTYLVESDSTDNTKEVLDELKRMYSNFEYAELGTLKNSIPDRIERIRFCRNLYIKFIRDNVKEKNWEYIIVADLDGMNRKLTPDAVNSCFEDTPNWDEEEFQEMDYDAPHIGEMSGSMNLPSNNWPFAKGDTDNHNEHYFDTQRNK